MDIKKITLITILLVLLTALSKYGIYTMPFRFFGMDGFFHPMSIASNFSAILFIISPIISLLFFLRESRMCYFWLGIFALPAFLFGVVPIPFANYLYSDNINLNTVFIGLINGGLIIFAVLGCRANKAFKSPTARTAKSAAV